MKKLLQFSAPWCQPCNVLSPILEKIAKELEIELEKLNIDENENKEIASKYQIRAIPTVILLEDDTPVDQFTRVIPEQKIREFLKRD